MSASQCRYIIIILHIIYRISHTSPWIQFGHLLNPSYHIYL